jgi:hypothetical protein
MTSQEVYHDYWDSLSQLTFNSKPVIVSLTELAYDYRTEHPKTIVKCIEERIRQVINAHLICI